RSADGDSREGATIQRLDRPYAAKRRAFCRPVNIRQERVRKFFLQTICMDGRKNLAAGKYLANTAQRGNVLINDSVEQGGRKECNIQSVCRHHAFDAGCRGDFLRVDNARASIYQRAPDFEGGRIEAWGGCMEYSWERVQTGIGSVLYQANDGLMFDHHSL